MDARLDILRAFEREPNRTFSTTSLVESLYPREMFSIQEQMRLGTREQRRAGQTVKSKLHRKTLYYVSQLLSEHLLEVVRLDAHGEKQYRVTSPHQTIHSKNESAHINQQTLRTHFIEEELDRKEAIIYEEQSVLSRCNSLFIDCTHVDGLGHLTKLSDAALHAVNDVVCLGNFQDMLGKYRAEHLEEFIDTLSTQTLDEGKTVCLLLDTRKAPVAEFVRIYASRLPRRILLVFVCDAKSVMSEPFLASMGYLQERSEKVNVHFPINHSYPIFVGHVGIYGFQAQDWQRFEETRAPACVVSQATIMLDLGRVLSRPAHEVRAAIVNSAKTIYALTSQQRQHLISVREVSSMHTEHYDIFASAHAYLRIWNYDWEEQSRIISSVNEELLRLARLQDAVYKACSLPSHCKIQLSSTFGKADKRLSTRNYRKWMVTSSDDLRTESFRRFVKERSHYLELFNNIDRLRIFRAGNPTPHQVAHELLELSQHGFPLVTVDFKPLRGVRRLTEYFS